MDAPTIIRGRLIDLSTPTEDDWARWLFFMNDLETMRALIPYFKRDTWTAEDLRARYERLGKSFTVTRKADQQVVGQAGMKNIVDGTAEVGWILHRSTWGTGIAIECNLLLLDYCFTTLGLDSIYFHTDPANDRSNGLLAKLGIRRTGQLPDGTLRYDLPVSDWPATRQRLLALQK